MSLTQNIVATYKGPRKVFRRLLAGAPDETRVLIFALLAGVMIFVAGAPFQAREAQLNPTSPLEARLYWSGFLWVMIFPIFGYLVAASWWLLSRLLAPHITGYGLRLSIFWTLLAASPVFLLTGLVAGFIGSGPQLQLMLWVSMAIVLWFFVSGMMVISENHDE